MEKPLDIHLKGAPHQEATLDQHTKSLTNATPYYLTINLTCTSTRNLEEDLTIIQLELLAPITHSDSTEDSMSLGSSL